MLSAMDDYDARLSAELRTFAGQQVIHDLPAIHHFWAQRFVMPLLAEVGISDINALWRREIAQQCRRCAPEPARLVSLGAGNGELELALAAALAQEGIENLELTLLELNGDMLERAAAEARRLGIEDRVHGELADLNRWVRSQPVDVYLANHSLHHIVELEHLCAQISSSLAPGGVLLVNDMIGRNGHQRWPEAAHAVRRIWGALPARYRRNHSLGRIDDEYPDLDCSTEGFEGIRSQDVLPLLLREFHPAAYVTFANVIDPFVDRIYGHNFDPGDPADAALIEEIATFDEAAIDAGVLTPTHLVSVFRGEACECRYPRRRSPERTVRDPNAEPGVPDGVTTGEAPGASGAPSPAGGDDSDDGDGWRRYHALRSRKAVRLALALADARHRRPGVRRTPS
jgi:SAM-dependent methyltransferase